MGYQSKKRETGLIIQTYKDNSLSIGETITIDATGLESLASIKFIKNEKTFTNVPLWALLEAWENYLSNPKMCTRYAPIT